jgi:hypothetical protein
MIAHDILNYVISYKTLKLFLHVLVDSEIQDSKFNDTPFSAGGFVEVSPSKRKMPCPKKNLNEDEEESKETEMSTQEDGIFSCPIEGCIKTFQRHYNLESHMSYRKCQLVTERNTLLDKAKILYQQKLSEGASEQPHIAAVMKASVSRRTSLAQGWALKTSKTGKRFNINQKKYMDEKFALGQETGHKADPEQVARDMRRVSRK